MPEPEVTICIPTCDRPDTVRHLLENIAACVALPYQLVVIDASTGNRTETVVKGRPEAVYLRSPKGLTLQRNKGIAAAQAPFTLMLDDDVQLLPDTVAQLVQALKCYPKLGGVSAWIENEHGKKNYRYQRLYHRLGIFETLRPGAWLYCGDFLQLSHLLPFQGIHTTDFLLGGVTLFRTNVIREIPPDTAFGFMAEDKEWTLRIGRKYDLAVCGDARIRHEHAGKRRNAFFIHKEKTTQYYRILCQTAGVPFRRKLVALLFQWLEVTRTLAAQCYHPRRSRLLQTAGIIAGSWVCVGILAGSFFKRSSSPLKGGGRLRKNFFGKLNSHRELSEQTGRCRTSFTRKA